MPTSGRAQSSFRHEQPKTTDRACIPTALNGLNPSFVHLCPESRGFLHWTRQHQPFALSVALIKLLSLSGLPDFLMYQEG